MKIIITFALFPLLVSVGNAADNEGSKSHHCEKTVGGKHEEIPSAKTRKECKKKGGKWQENHKKEDHEPHQNKSEDGHKKKTHG